MESHEYLDLVTGQMRCKKARGMVEEELKNHIDDQIEKYIEFGLDEEKAEAEAVSKMGDPIQVGTDMDRIHRPKMDYKTLMMVGIFSIIGVIVQVMTIASSQNLNGNLNENIINTLVFFGIGLVVMTVIMFLDYSILSKYFLPIYLMLLLVLVFSDAIGGSRYAVGRMGHTFLEALYLMMIPVFAAFVYSQRNHRYKGIISCVALLVFTLCLVGTNSKIYLSERVDLFFIGMVTISFAIIKGWFSVNRKWSILTLWLTWVTPLTFGVIGLMTGAIGATYQTERLKAFFNPIGYEQSSAYHMVNMRMLLGELKLFGPCDRIADASLFGASSSYDFGYLLCRFGIVGGVLLVAGIGVLIAFMLGKVLKQPNRLGTLVGLSCVLAMSIPAVRNVLISLTLFPSTTSILPFLSVSGEGTIGVYILIGIYLSIYRNSNIISEKNMQPGFSIKVNLVKNK